MPTTINGTTGVSLIQDGVVVQADLASGVAGTGPAFSAHMGSSQTVSNLTATKLQFNIEDFDTNSNYDPTTNYRFTPTVAGYYEIIVSCSLTSTNALHRVIPVIHKNGDQYKIGASGVPSGSTFPAGIASTILFMNGSTDFVEGFVFIDVGSGTASIAGDFPARSQFSGALVRAA